jgi:hypothetical protein
LIGISQYDCIDLGHCPEISTNAPMIESAIRAFIMEIEPFLHLDDVVVDVFVKRKVMSPTPQFGVKLLELNPFFRKTDACLFTLNNGGDFDGSFRYLGQNSKVIT